MARPKDICLYAKARGVDIIICFVLFPAVLFSTALFPADLFFTQLKQTKRYPKVYETLT